MNATSMSLKKKKCQIDAEFLVQDIRQSRISGVGLFLNIKHIKIESMSLEKSARSNQI